MLALLLLACADPPPPGGTTPRTEPPVDLVPNRACLVPSDAVPEDYGRTSYGIEVFGRIVEVGTGIPPGGCRDREEWVGGVAPDWGTSTTSWIEIETAGGDFWYAAATNAWIPDPIALRKEEVRVSFRSLLGDEASGTSTETEMSFEGSNYRFYLGTAGALDVFEPMPEVAIRQGEPEVEVEEECGTQIRYFLDVDRDGETHSIATGESYGLDGISVWSGGVFTSESTDCVPRSYAAIFEWQIE